MGLAAILSFSNSASWRRLALALLFWNQIFTCVSVRVRDAENSALSAMLRYCFSRNFLSNARSWDVVNGVRGFLLGLCFRRVILWGAKRGAGGTPMEETGDRDTLKTEYTLFTKTMWLFHLITKTVLLIYEGSILACSFTKKGRWLFGSFSIHFFRSLA